MAELIDYPSLRLPLGGGTHGAVGALWAGYQHIIMEDKQRRKERFAAICHQRLAGLSHGSALTGDALYYHLYDKAVSIFQAKTGDILNKLVQSVYSGLFAAHGTSFCEVKQPIGERKLDLVFVLPRGNLYVSVCGSAAERKKTDWRVEAQDIEAHHRGKPRRWVFIGMFFSDKVNHTLRQNQEAREGLQGHVGQLCTVVCVQDQAHHASVLSSVLSQLL